VNRESAEQGHQNGAEENRGNGDGENRRNSTVRSRWNSTVRGRWAGAASLALVAVGVGIVVGRPSLLLAAVIPLALSATAETLGPPSVDDGSLSLRREISETEPEPGSDVRVTVQVRNETDGTLRDLRLTDNVPPALTVTEGTPECVTALRPGATATISYTVTAARGRHEFGAVEATVATAVGSASCDLTLDGPTTVVECVPRLSTRTTPPERAVAALAGPTTSRQEGAGIEFSSIREYRRGDPASRIDWQGWARRGEPATISFRAERTARVVLVVDARRSGYALDATRTPVVERSLSAAGTLASGLLSAGHRVGVAALGPRECFLRPGVGDDHRRRIERTLALDPAFGYERWAGGDGAFGYERWAGGDGADPSDDATGLSTLRRQLPTNVRVVVCTPLLDEQAVDACLRLRADGHHVAVVSPATGDADSATADSERNGTRMVGAGRESADLVDTAARFAAVRRESRLSSLRSRGLTAVDLGTDDPSRALRRRWPL
jgi:uncharacterized protein (DUF58 family)